MTDTTKLLDDVLKCKPLYWPTNYEKEILAALRFAKAMQPRPISEAPRDGTEFIAHDLTRSFRCFYKKNNLPNAVNKETLQLRFQPNLYSAAGHWFEPTHFTPPLPDQALKEFEEDLK